MYKHVIITLLVAGVSPYALALSASAEGFATESASDFSLETIVVSATRTEKKLVDVAASISVITQDDIDATLSGDIRDMLRYEPGVEATNAGRFGLSGFNIRGLSGNRVKILIDGTEQSKGFSSGPWLNSPRNFIDIDVLAQVEILRGPASSLYGSDALAGVVSFTTKNPSAYLDATDNDTGGQAKILFDSVNNSYAETLTLANRTGKLESMVQYTRRDGNETENFGESYAGGIGDERHLPNPYSSSSDNILAKLVFTANDAHTIRLTGEYFHSSSHIDLLTLEGPTYNAYFNYSDYTGDDVFERKHIGLTHDWQADTALFDYMSWTVDWQKSSAEEETRNFTAAFGYNHRLIDYSHNEEDIQVSAQFDKKASNHHFTYGFVYQHARQENKTDKFYLDGGLDPDIARYTPVVKGNTIGVYLQDQIELLSGKLLLSPSLRYDRFKATPQADDRYTVEQEEHTSDKVTFRTGAVYKFTEEYSMFAQFSQGFKAPGLSQLYREDQTSIYRGYITLANPDLNPEKSNSFELGFRADNKIGNFELVGFYSSFDDFIEQPVEVIDGISVFQYDNYAEATIKGIEARASVWLDDLLGAPKGLAFQAAFAYAKGETEQDGIETPINSIAPRKLVMGLTYDSSDDIWGIGANVTLSSDKNEDTIGSTGYFAPGGYALFDVSGYANLTDSLTLRAGLFNLTDKEYWLWEDVRGYAADTSYINRFTQPGRNASVSLQYRF